jgi:hypothetical protein
MRRALRRCGYAIGESDTRIEVREGGWWIEGSQYRTIGEILGVLDDKDA